MSMCRRDASTMNRHINASCIKCCDAYSRLGCTPLRVKGRGMTSHNEYYFYNEAPYTAGSPRFIKFGSYTYRFESILALDLCMKMDCPRKDMYRNIRYFCISGILEQYSYRPKISHKQKQMMIRSRKPGRATSR